MVPLAECRGRHPHPTAKDPSANARNSHYARGRTSCSSMTSRPTCWHSKPYSTAWATASSSRPRPGEEAPATPRGPPLRRRPPRPPDARPQRVRDGPADAGGRPHPSHPGHLLVRRRGGRTSLVAEAYDLGAVDYLVKPLVPDVLRAKAAVFVDLFRTGERVRALERRDRERAEAAMRETEVRFERFMAAPPRPGVDQGPSPAGTGTRTTPPLRAFGPRRGGPVRSDRRRRLPRGPGGRFSGERHRQVASGDPAGVQTVETLTHPDGAVRHSARQASSRSPAPTAARALGRRGSDPRRHRPAAGRGGPCGRPRSGRRSSAGPPGSGSGTATCRSTSSSGTTG